ncbi:MIS1-C1-tetrahydrofolate synthase precursor, mitochondrial [Fusarium fujikuroi]|nr:MIS1-C1-tetrahydrofolate synthase precursor, mitochondrial [Fusarium fujikuroi]
MSLQPSAEALVTRIDSTGTPRLVKEKVPVPKPGEHQLLVKSFDSNAFGDGAILGCDFVGVVEEIGPNVTRIAKGTVIAGLIWGGEIKGLGGYSQYTIADERICFPVPQQLSPEAASTVPLASCTALLGLLSKGCLAIDTSGDEKPAVLIWGGSSSVGLYAIQIARFNGLQVITTCSPKHHDLVKLYGAAEAFDYRDPQVVERIRQAAPGLRYVFDTIGNTTSSNTASLAISHQDGVLCTVRPGKANTEEVAPGVKITNVLVWTAFMKEHRYGEFHWPASREDHKLASDFFQKLPSLLTSGQIKPNSHKLFENGFDDVCQGFQDHDLLLTFAKESEKVLMEGFELLTAPLGFQDGSARLLTGDLVVRDIERWCHRKADKGGIEPVMAVVFFNTGPDAVDYVKIKAHVAARAGVDYWVYEMPIDASTIEVMSQVKELNMDPQIHGILIQRPLPQQLNEAKIMRYIDPVKNIEEYDKGQADNIAADALVRLLARYGLLESAHQAKIQIVGFGNIITKEFIKQMKRQFPYVSASKDFDLSYDTSQDKRKALDEEVQAPRASIIISELHRGPGFIKESMIKPEVSVLVDLGFYVTEKGVIGDVSHALFDRSDLAIAPTPGGVLPILLWIMMERTIKAKQMIAKEDLRGCCCSPM